MKEKMKFVMAAVLLCLVLILLVAVVFPAVPSAEKMEPESEQTILTLVYAYQNTKWSSCVEEVIRRFEAENPHIDIQ